ncbi:MAG TPA: CoA-binding protein [Candidatus Bathyarchaeia archaeon]|nr:CoA-binding protein [Candidatus Bathyarchaeia archaeon]
MFANPPDETIRAILAVARTVAVVGCSEDPRRDSNRIARLLRAKGHRILPVNPNLEQALGLPCYPSLAAIPEAVEMVDVFRRPEHVAAVVDEVIAIGARILWLQLGVIDEQAAERAASSGMTVVMDRCPAIEYPRLF